VVRVSEGFAEFDVETSGTRIHDRRGGDGPPVLVLHGIPQTHLRWHRVALPARRAVHGGRPYLRGFEPVAAVRFVPEEAPEEATRQLLEFLA
jgi:haloacetate dehalogenase